MTRRIARAKERVRKERIPYEVPSRAELANRLGAVLQVVYLVYNEGFATTKGKDLIRTDLAEQALYLGRLIVDLLRSRAWACWPHAVSRIPLAARTDAHGDVIPLEDQDRRMEAGADSGGWLGPSLLLQPFRSYTLQAAMPHSPAASVGGPTGPRSCVSTTCS
jgi:RNA polymerase sigma-70 factor (ECF subfamily)